MPSDDKLYDVFLSHSNMDRNFVLRLKADLEAHSVTVWQHEDQIIAGDPEFPGGLFRLCSCQVARRECLGGILELTG